MFKYYSSSLIFTVIALILGAVLGGPAGVLIVGIIAVMETSLSFDNAVVNASVLKNWDALWRHRFITYGMPVAVFGMRLVFPLLIVGIVAHLNPIEAVQLAINSPKDYEHILGSVHHEISAFGGAFLMMIFLSFFFDEEKESHWVSFIEGPLSKIGKLDMVQAGTTLIVLFLATQYVDAGEKLAFFGAGVWGLVTFIAAQAVGTLLGGEDGGDEMTKNIIKQGIGGLLYLEILDASFSFDGVMAAFALTNNIFVMALGLGTGAMFVRSMTLHLVDKGTLSEFRYLEHGAFWAIGALATVMFISPFVDVPDVVTGLIGAGMIVVALISSIMANRKDAAEAALVPVDAQGAQLTS